MQPGLQNFWQDVHAGQGSSSGSTAMGNGQFPPGNPSSNFGNPGEPNLPQNGTLLPNYLLQSTGHPPHSSPNVSQNLPQSSAPHSLGPQYPFVPPLPAPTPDDFRSSQVGIQDTPEPSDRPAFHTPPIRDAELEAGIPQLKAFSQLKPQGRAISPS